MSKDEKPQQLTLWFSYEIRVEPKAPESVIELEAFTLVRDLKFFEAYP